VLTICLPRNLSLDRCRLARLRLILEEEHNVLGFEAEDALPFFPLGNKPPAGLNLVILLRAAAGVVELDVGIRVAP